MAKIVIIGAGATGLSAAFHLERKGFFDYILVEKEAKTGGLCRSVSSNGFTFDYSGHVLHVNDDYFRSFIATIVGFQHFNRIVRRSFIYSHGRYTDYPYQINLHGLPANVITECIEGYVNRKRTRGTPRSFIDWVNCTFGAGFGKHFFFPYQRKIFAYNLHKISASWTGRFVPKTSLNAMLMGALKKTVDETVGYNAQFYYPSRGGISFWVDKLAQQLHQPVYTNCTITRVDARNKRVLFADGSYEPYDQLINTMPLNTFLGMLDEPSNVRVKRTRTQLKCNQVTTLNLGIVGTHWHDRHWVYVPEKKYPLYRFGFPHNLSANMAPNGCSSIAAEVAHFGKKLPYADMVRNALIDILGFDESDIVTEKVIPIKHAYVIYDHWRDRNLAHIHKRLNSLEIYSVGRYGEWKYSSMQETVLDGKKIADQMVIMPAQRTMHVPELSVPQQKLTSTPAQSDQ